MPPAAAPAPMPMQQAAPAPTPEMPAAAPSAQQYVQGMQDDIQAAAAMQAPVEPIMPAVLQEEDNTIAASPSVNGVNPVMQDQVYADPSAFHIPGM